MGPSWQCLLLCGHLLSIAAVPIDSSKDDIAEIIHFNNKFVAKNFLFKLLKVEYEGDSYVPETSTIIKVLKFSIKETTCAISDTNDLQNCDFKPDGLLMACAARVTTHQQEKTIKGQCMETNRKKGEHAIKRDVVDKTQKEFEISVDPEKSHKQECLECIITHLP